MERKIEQINVWNTKNYTEIKVYFVNESRYGTHTKFHAVNTYGVSDPKWQDENISPEELKTAKSLAVKDGKRTNYRAPHQETEITKSFKKDEEELDAEAQAEYHNSKPSTTFASTTDRES